MTDYQSMSARQLRKVAPTLGVTGASRMTKDEILAAIAATPQPFDREARDALHRTPQVAYDPAGHIPAGARVRPMSRAQRRSRTFTAWQDNTRPVIVAQRRKRSQIDRKATMIPAVRLGGALVPAVDAAPPAQRRSASRRLMDLLGAR